MGGPFTEEKRCPTPPSTAPSTSWCSSSRPAQVRGDLQGHPRPGRPGTIRLYDIFVVRKGADGTSTPVDLTAAEGSLAELAALAGARSGLLGRG